MVGCQGEWDLLQLQANENTFKNNVLKDQLHKSGVIEVEEEKDLYDELIEAMWEGNIELTDKMMDRILDRFEAVGDEERKNLLFQAILSTFRFKKNTKKQSTP